MPAVPAGRRVVLVPGQAEDDASIRLGCVDVCTHEALLRAARAAAPQAFLICKPHPDVLSGNRAGRVPAYDYRMRAFTTAEAVVDAIVRDRETAAAQGFGAPWWVRQRRKLTNLWRGLTHG